VTRRLLFLVAALAAALALAGPALAEARTIYVRNLSALDDAAVADALPAFQAAIDEDFEPAWNARAELVFIGQEQAPVDGWRIVLVDVPACWFCAGFHQAPRGIPRAEVGVLDPDPSAWQVTFTHELFEVLADPLINRGIVVGKTWYALEVCDPVEDNAFAYTRTSASGLPVEISDFVLENWFRPHSRGPYDFMRHTARPLQILENGYQLVWHANAWAYGRGAAGRS
jgi:hypothetical protein